MSENKCFCHLNGYEVKDAQARNEIEILSNNTNVISDNVNLLGTRMNEFTKLQEGSTTADSEIVDARIGADGVVYANLGEAIRTQFNSAKENLNVLQDDFIKNVYEINEHQFFDPYKVKLGGYYHCNGNYVESLNHWNLTFDVEEGKSYFFAKIDKTTATNTTTGTVFCICPVKSDGSFYCSSAGEIQWKGNYTVPEGSGITKLIVSGTMGNLVDGLYCITDVVPSSKNPYSEKYHSKIEKEKRFNISCIGDSLTEGYGGGGVTYPSVLGENNPRFKMFNMGHPSKATEYIAYATGGTPIYVQPVIIPAEVTPIQITIKNTTNTNVVLDRLTQAINPVTIAGIEGEISLTSGSMYFTRKTAGVETVIDRPVKINTNFEKSHTEDVCVIWCGTNDTSNGASKITSETGSVINMIKNIIETLETKNYIVVAPISKAYHSNVETIQVYFKRAFGKHFVNLRQYILDYGLNDAGLTPTEQDIADIENGEIPSSLRFDTVHLNSTGYTVIGNFLYKELKARGYVD